jgi:hypothetical protein
MRRQIIDYFGTRPSEGHVPHIPRGLSRPRGDNLSTTIVLDLRMGQALYFQRGISSSMRQRIIRLLQYSIFGWDKFPISQGELFVHQMTNYRLLWYSIFRGTCSPYPKKILSSMRQLFRLLRYSILRWDQLPISQKRNFLSSMRRQLIEYFGTRSSDGTSSLSPRT